MTKTHIYRRPKDNLFWLIAATFQILAAIYILSTILQADKFHWLAPILPVIFGLLGVVLFRVYFLRQQYHKVDQNKVVTVNSLRKELVINQGGIETIVNRNEINNVEIYDSWNTNPLFDKLSYVKFNLSNGKHIKVTRYTANDIDLQPMITGKPVKRKTRLMNPIK